MIAFCFDSKKANSRLFVIAHSGLRFWTRTQRGWGNWFQMEDSACRARRSPRLGFNPPVKKRKRKSSSVISQKRKRRKIPLTFDQYATRGSRQDQKKQRKYTIEFVLPFFVDLNEWPLQRKAEGKSRKRRGDGCGRIWFGGGVTGLIFNALQQTCRSDGWIFDWKLAKKEFPTKR